MAKLITGAKSTTPISNISYVDIDTFKNQIENLQSQFAVNVAYIYHKGEFGKKDHIHYVIKSKGVGISNIPKIQSIMFNFDTDGNPCDSLLFAQCKSLGDYYLYVLHDRKYLEVKEETKEIYDYDPALFQGDTALVAECVQSSEEVMKNLPVSNLTQLSDFVLNGYNNIEILSKMGRDLKLTEIGLALKSLDGLRKELDSEADLGRFYGLLFQFTLDHLNKGDAESVRCLRLIENSTHLSPVQIGLRLFTLFLDRLTERDIVHYILEG